ncbi:MAG: 4-hydroxybenzoate octaprenyltransferase [Chromatiales bacterium]|nr:4-hydroxybenzoate octaprenyltransferase [Chromatiales bacterium]
MSRLREYALLMRMDKPIGSLLLLWPTLWALWIASEGMPEPLILAVFVTGVFVMRSAGCVVNDISDRDIDGHVERTQARPLAAGTVTVREAVMLAAGLGAIAFALVCLMNSFTIALSVVGALLAATYPLMKRITYLPQAYLGIAFGWGIPMAFAAVNNALPNVAWYLLATNIIWAIAYDTMYAMSDREDDLKIGVKSSAILFGQADRAIVAILQCATLGLLIGLGAVLGFGGWFAGAMAAAIGFSMYQQHLIRERQRLACFRAFLNNNWVGAAVFAGIVLEYL